MQDAYYENIFPIFHEKELKHDKMMNTYFSRKIDEKQRRQKSAMQTPKESRDLTLQRLFGQLDRISAHESPDQYNTKLHEIKSYIESETEKENAYNM